MRQTLGAGGEVAKALAITNPGLRQALSLQPHAWAGTHFTPVPPGLLVGIAFSSGSLANAPVAAASI